MPSPEYQFLKEEVVQKLIQKAPEQRIRIAIRILSRGLRPCEILRLNVNDIVLENDPPYIFVRKPKGYNKQPYRWCKICKERFSTEYSAHEHETIIKNQPAQPRKVPIEDPIMIDDLQVFLEKRKPDEPLLVTDRQPRRRLSYSMLAKLFKDLAMIIRKPELIMYDLRHFFGKSMKKRGIPDSVGSTLMGNSVVVYADTYGQLDVSDLDEVLKQFPTDKKF